MALYQDRLSYKDMKALISALGLSNSPRAHDILMSYRILSTLEKYLEETDSWSFNMLSNYEFQKRAPVWPWRCNRRWCSLRTSSCWNIFLEYPQAKKQSWGFLHIPQMTQQFLQFLYFVSLTITLHLSLLFNLHFLAQLWSKFTMKCAHYLQNSRCRWGPSVWWSLSSSWACEKRVSGRGVPPVRHVSSFRTWIYPLNLFSKSSFKLFVTCAQCFTNLQIQTLPKT